MLLPGCKCGDKYIDEDNIEYEIIEVGGNRPSVKRKVDLLADIGPEFAESLAKGRKRCHLYTNDESIAGQSIDESEIHEVGCLESPGEGITVIGKNLHLPAMVLMTFQECADLVRKNLI